MDSDSDSNTSVHNSRTAAFCSTTTIPLSSGPDDPQFERGPRGEQFLIVNHTANRRNGSEVSKIWFHGEERRRIDDKSNDRYWRCSHCKHKRYLKISEAGGGATSHAVRHLKNHHRLDLDADEQAIPVRPTSLFSSVATAATAAVATGLSQATTSTVRTAKALISTLDMTRFRYLLIRWIVMMNICLSVVEHDSWRDMMIFCHVGLTPYLVKSATTIRKWILKEFERQKLAIKEELAGARSRIHISADLWTSPNSLAIVGIVAHYLDKDLKVQSHLIGMRRVRGAHSGENIAEAMIPVLQDFDIAPRLGYYIGDNHGANDTCLRAICRKLRPDIKDPDTRRVRCLGHILNLAAKAFLFGKDAESFEEETNQKRSAAHIEKLRELWRKKGPIGKLHNTVLHVRVTPQRREDFLKVMEGIIDKDLEGLMVIADNDTRWNSTYLSILRGLKLKHKIQVYSLDERASLGSDYLEESDWKSLQEIADCLEPFYQCTLELQGQAKTAQHGVIWEALPAMEGLLGHLEKLKVTVPKTNKPLREAVNNAWVKLREYYDLTDNSHGIYAAASLFYPCLRLAHFKEHWTGEMATWIEPMTETVEGVWKEEYYKPAQEAKQKAPETTDSEPPKKKHFTFRYWITKDSTDEEDNELASYMNGKPKKLKETDKSFNPINWWIDKKTTYPTLYQYALDTLSCPAMSTECERVFSSAKKLLTPERNQLAEDIIEACECLKAWWKKGLIQQRD